MGEFVYKIYRRTPLKTLLYLVLIIACSASLCIGFNLQYISQQNRQNAKAAFSAIAMIEENQGFYSDDAVATEEERVRESKQREFEEQILKNSDAVQSIDVRFPFSAKVDQITEVPNSITFTNDTKLDGENIVIFTYHNDNHIEVLEVLYGDPSYKNTKATLHSESNEDILFVSNKTYIAFGTFEKKLWEDTTYFTIRDFEINYYPTYGLFYDETEGGYKVWSEEEQLSLFGKAQPKSYKGVQSYEEKEGYWEDILYAYTISENAIGVMVTSDAENIFDFHERNAWLVSGNYFTKEDYTLGNKKCLISQTLATLNNLSVGDVVDVTMMQHGSVLGDGVWAYRYEPSFPEFKGNIIGKLKYEISGIFYEGGIDYYGTRIQNVSEQMIIVPDTSFRWDMKNRLLENMDFLSYRLSLDNIEEFLHEVKDFKAYHITLYDQGYRLVEPSIQQFGTTANIMMVISMVSSLSILLVFLYFNLMQRRKDVMVMQALGVKPKRVWGTLVLGAVVVTLISSIVGSILGYRLTSFAIDMIQKANEENLSEVALVELYGNGIHKEFELVYETSVWLIPITILFLVGMIAILTSVISYVFIRKLKDPFTNLKKWNSKRRGIQLGLAAFILSFMGLAFTFAMNQRAKTYSYQTTAQQESGNNEGINSVNSPEPSVRLDESKPRGILTAVSDQQLPESDSMDLTSTEESKLNQLNVEDGYVLLGSYPQDEVTEEGIISKLNDAAFNENQVTMLGEDKYSRVVCHDSNGDSYRYFQFEAIRWKILYDDGEEILLISEKNLDSMPFDKETQTTWESSSLRTWLNGSTSNSSQAEGYFLSTAFNQQEQQYLTSSEKEEMISDVKDKVFILSEQESKDERYGLSKEEFDLSKSRISIGTEYATLKSATALKYIIPKDYPASNYWWLRTKGTQSRSMKCVYDNGSISPGGYDVTCDQLGVRPAIRIPSYVISKNEMLTKVETLTVKDQTLYFGSYPQGMLKDWEITQDVKNASYDKNGDALVNGVKIRRIDRWAKEDPNNMFFPIWEESYRYFYYEPIRWRVLSVTEQEVILLSEYGIDCNEFCIYRDDYTSQITWENSTIRSWLNGYTGDKNIANIDYSKENSFYLMAFNKAEQDLIMNSRLVNDDDPFSNTDGGLDTDDKVYLLSLKEVTDPNYQFSPIDVENDPAKYMKYTDYSMAKGGQPLSMEGVWWLRSPGDSPNLIAMVDASGDVTSDLDSEEISVYCFQSGNVIDTQGEVVDLAGRTGIRPVIKLPVSSVTFSN